MKKRAFDITLTIGTAIVWLPLLLVLASTILITSGRPMFYISSRRVDRHGEIRLWKLRTMVKNADKIVNRDTVPVDGVAFLNIDPSSPLYTRIGREIERFDLTELPQLFHVLRGQMSLVGSRPLPVRVVEELRRHHPDVDNRFLTRAGVAGPTQLVGRANLSDADRLDLESRYCRIAETSYSVWIDFRILLRIGLTVIGLRKPMTYVEAVAFISQFDKAGVNEPWRPRIVDDVEAETHAVTTEAPAHEFVQRREEAS